MASAPSQQGQDEAQRRRAALAVGGGVAAAAAAGAPAYAGAQTAQAIPAKAARVAALSAITAALVTFLTRQRQQTRAWLERRLPVAARGLAPNDVQQVIADEEVRDQAFAEKQAERMTSDLTAALAIPDPREREQRVQMILAREQRYARMRSEAMAARAFAAVDRLVLRTESPQGAFWRLDPNVKEHTAGCVAAETLVAGPEAARGFRREYAGKLVEVVVASGDELRITPNHPILTPRGWRPAGLLREGDEVLRDGANVERQRGRVEDPRDVRSIEQVFEAIEQLPSAARGARRMKRFDFHGDFTDAEVDVVAADRRLLRHVCAEGAQRVREALLVGGDPSPAAGAAGGRSLRALLRERDVAEGFAAGPNLLDIASPLFRGHRGDREADSLTVASADLHASVEQHTLECFARNGQLVGEPLEGMPGVVTRDHVVEIRHFDWAGHVYNLSTAGGWYTGNGLILQNCLIMGGRFWPWAVLDRVHPPRHPGCPCRLVGYGEAVKLGMMGAGDVLDVRDAIAQAAHVVMEFDAEAAEGLDRELALLELRDVLIERDLTTPDQFDRLLPLVKR